MTKRPLTLYLNKNTLLQNGVIEPVMQDFEGFYTVKDLDNNGNEEFTFQFSDEYYKRRYGDLIVTCINNHFDYNTTPDKEEMYGSLAIAIHVDRIE